MTGEDNKLVRLGKNHTLPAGLVCMENGPGLRGGVVKKVHVTDQFVCDLLYDVCVVESAAVVLKHSLHPQTRLVGVKRQEVVEPAHDTTQSNFHKAKPP